MFDDYKKKQVTLPTGYISKIFDLPLTDWVSNLCTSVPRTLFSWRDNPLKEPDPSSPTYAEQKMIFDDCAYVDHFCRLISDLPSMKGLVEICPDVAAIDLYKSYLEEESDSVGWYDNATNEIDMNVYADLSYDRNVDTLIAATIPHELKHGGQNHQNVLAFRQDPLFENAFARRIMFARIIEGDATVFSVVLAYEMLALKNDFSFLDALKESERRPVVDAYMAEIDKDADAHWDGRAARAGFIAYFSESNAKLLTIYDEDLCEKFIYHARDYRVEEPLETPELDAAFMAHIHPLTRLPYIDGNGALVERSQYLNDWPLTPKGMIAHLSEASKYALSELKSDGFDLY